MLASLVESRIVVSVLFQGNVGSDFVVVGQKEENGSEVLFFRTRSSEFVLGVPLSHCFECVDEFGVVNGWLVNADVDDLQHARVVIARTVLFDIVVFGRLLVKPNRQTVLSVLFVNLGDSFLNFGDVGNSVVLHIDRNCE